MKSEIEELVKKYYSDVISEILTPDTIKQLSKQWASQRSVGNKRQDEECAYDYEMGMRAAYTILKGEPVK